MNGKVSGNVSDNVRDSVTWEKFSEMLPSEIVSATLLGNLLVKEILSD